MNATSTEEKNEVKNIKGIFIHYDNGEQVNITDLPKEDYERFIESMHKARLAYIALTQFRS